MLALGLTILSLIIWLFLLLFWGNFWLANQRIKPTDNILTNYPWVIALVPARNEAAVLPISLPSLLNQDYSGSFTVILVDDNSTDDTAKIATELIINHKLQLISGKPLATGWQGKLWAIKQGIEYIQQQKLQPDYFLFTDADIQHDQYNLKQLVTKAELENLDLVSLMVLLRCESGWEKLLIPAFVFFFQKLYPFPWVNDCQSSTAAAAGGCILIRRQALLDIGGVEAIKDALIDDCSLAKAVKSKSKHGIWLGLTTTTVSLRAYQNLQSIWQTIARTAFTQLNYSILLLILTIMGMSLVYLVPPIGLIWGLIAKDYLVMAITIGTWLLMTIAYLPTIRLYKISSLWAVCLPAIALLYSLMTIDSAVQHWQGQGGAWKERTYGN